MTNNESHHCGGTKFMTGLMWGAIIGGGLVFLLGTKKGKSIIKALSEEGIELSELLGDDEEEEIEEIIVRPKSKAHKQESAKAVGETEQEEDNIHQESNGIKKASAISKIAKTSRRFFRGTPKR